jgi:hypothetical protein
MRSFIRFVALAFLLCAVILLCPCTATAKPVRVTGIVVDYRAKPVDGAIIMLYNEPREPSLGRRLLVKLAETRSSADGQFDLAVERNEEVFPGTWWLIAYQKGLALCWTTQSWGVRSSIIRLGRVEPLGGVVVDETGRPIAGAKVSLCVKNEMMEPREFPLPGPEEWHTRRTDSDGRFLFDNLPPDTTADFKIEAPGRAHMWTFRDFGAKEGEQFPVGRTDIRIALPPEAHIEGTVVDEDTGKPVSAVRVLARSRQGAGAGYCDEPVTVDPSGRFILTGLTAGAYVLDVVAPAGQVQEWFSSAPVLTVQHAQATRNVRLAVNRGATLEVVMREPDSEAGVAGVRVQVSGDHFTRVLTTDTNGLARLHVPPGKCSISGAYPDHQVELEKGQSHREEMRVAMEAVHVSGTVSDQEGHLLGGSSVMHWPFGLAAVTDAHGRFEYMYYTTGSGSKRTVLARHESSGLADIVELRDPSDGRRPEGKITLKQAYSLVGRVTDPNGAGIPAASVRLVLGSPQRFPRRISTVADLITDANGAYQIRAVPKPPDDFDAHYYAVVVRAPGYNENSVDPVILEGSVKDAIEVRPIVLQPADQSVSGIVVDVSDKPVPGASVSTPGLRPYGYDEHEDTRQPHRQVSTDAQGRFQMGGICRGPVELTARAPAADSQEGVTYTLAGEGSIRVVLGQTLRFTKSLTGSPLPAWSQLGLSGSTADLEGKAILLCFVDIQQRPSRHLLKQLAERGKELAERNVVLVGVQAAKCEPNEMDKLAAECGQNIRFGAITGTLDDAQRAWGMQSLPWLILADKSHVIRAEGFAPTELQTKLNEVKGDL